MATAQPVRNPGGGDTGRLLPGTAVGRFEIVRLLGMGSMGAVYLARDPLIDREVAVKTLAGDFSVSAGELHLLRRRFLNEARSAGALRHPGIVTVYDVIEAEDGRVSIAMEYVAGRSLRAILDDVEPLPLDFIQRTVASIGATLDHAHSRDLVHRDIKPANIMFTSDGDLKIADFGIASLRGNDLAGELNSLGTPNYLAPERIMGREADHRADIYALAVILYEMLTRRLPYNGTSMGELARNVVQGKYADPASLRPDLPAIMVKILAEGLATDPDLRYQKAGDLARDVREAVDAQVALSGTVPAADGLVEELELLEPLVIDCEPEGASEESAAPEAGHGATDLVHVVPRRVMGRPRKLMQVAALAVGGLLVTAVVLGVMGIFGGDPTAEAEESLESRRRVEYQALLTESERLFAAGDFRGAQAALSRAEALSPEAASIAQLRTEAARQQRLRRHGERMAEAKAHFLDAQVAFEAEDLSATEVALDLLFEVDETHEGGLALASAVSAVRSALAKASPRRKLPEPVVEIVEDDLVEEAFVIEVPQVVSSEPWVDPFGTIRIDFRSERPKGVLTLYLDGEQIFRRSFRFVEKKGLMRRRGVPGGFDARQQVTAGDLALRVYLSLPGRPAQSRTITGNFAPGSLRTLTLRVDEEGKLAANLL